MAATRHEIGFDSEQLRQARELVLRYGWNATAYITDHYRNYPAMLVRLSTVQPDDLRKLITESWRRSAPGELVAAYDGQS